MGKVLIAAYLVGAVIAAFVVILMITAAEVDVEMDGAGAEDGVHDAPMAAMGKGMGLALACILVVTAAAAWLPLLILMLRSAWREMEEFP